MFTTSVRGGKAFAAEQKIRQLNKNNKIEQSKIKNFTNRNDFKVCSKQE